MKWVCPYQGTDWVFDDDRLTATEARIQKRLTEGMTPVQADQARQDADPDALVAALVIARRRAGLDPVEAAQVDPDEFDVVEALGSTLEAAQEAMRAPREAKPARRARRAPKPVEKPAEDEPAPDAAA